MNLPSPSATIIRTKRFVVRNLASTHLPDLQALFERNPEFFLAVNGRLPFANEAEIEFNEMPPEHLPYGHRWFAGVYDESDALHGVLHFVSDLMAPSVWHIALFLLATHLHGTGAAREIYSELESWMHRSGANWIRLGVVAGNVRGERFWDRMGYRQIRVRAGVDTGGKINDMRMLLKPLTGASVDQYFHLVPRDAPGSA